MSNLPPGTVLPGLNVKQRFPLLYLIFERCLFSIMLLVAVSVLIFGGLEALHGGFATIYLGQSATPQAVANVREELGLNRPGVSRYVQWLGKAVKGDFGTSWASKNSALGIDQAVVRDQQAASPSSKTNGSCSRTERGWRRVSGCLTMPRQTRCRRCLNFYPTASATEPACATNPPIPSLRQPALPGCVSISEGRVNPTALLTANIPSSNSPMPAN